MLQQTTRDWDKSVEVKQQVIDYFSRTPALQISIKLTHRKLVPDRQYQTEKSSTTLPVGFSCLVYDKRLSSAIVEVLKLSKIHILAMLIWQRQCRLPRLCSVYTRGMNYYIHVLRYVNRVAHNKSHRVTVRVFGLKTFLQLIPWD